VTIVVTKEQMLKAIQDLPEDASVEEAIEQLYLLEKIERGIAHADAGQTVPHDEALRRLHAWQDTETRRAIAEADAGAPFVQHEHVAAWLRSWGTENELPPPE
jgi:predicted transcriptional regulator